MNRQPLTVVALSGGVDSATCAGLLVERGERVIGISMRLYNAKGTESSAGGRCCGPRDLEDARAVCAHLGIPFYVADYEKDFESAVIDDFVATYRAGRTPNPCVRCNEKVKFLPLLQRARALGATALCTGHYARILPGADGEPELHRARDAAKDQSYFLFGMPRAALAEVQFPLGDLVKDEVRAHARRLGLPNADKAESQEICFLPDGNYASFVEARAGQDGVLADAPIQGGEIVDQSGAVLGTHRGIHHYTIGQRRGLGVATGEPQYIVGIDALSRRVQIGPKSALYSDSARIGELHWLCAPPAVGEELELDVQIRYRRAPKAARLTVLPDGVVEAHFESAELAVTPGQAAVFYRGERVLGGGFVV